MADSEGKGKKTGEITQQKVLIVDKNGTVNNQKKLDVVLSSPHVTKIKIKTDKKKEFIIHADCLEKELLIVDAPESEVIISGPVQEIRKISGKVTDHTVIESWPIDRPCKAVITQFFSENEMEVEYISAVYPDDFYEPGIKLRICFQPEEVNFVPTGYGEDPEKKIKKGVKLLVGDEIEIGVEPDEIGEDYLHPIYIAVYEEYRENNREETEERNDN